MSDRHGVGLVGLGQISAPHLAGYAGAADRIEVVAVCDTDAARAQSVAHELGARAYTDLDDLLADDRVVSVDLALPHHVHFPAARAALAAGKHVLVEKPLSPTSAECRALIEQAEAAGLSLGVAENTRFVAAYQAVARLVRAGAIGEPRLVRTLISGSEVRAPQRSDAVEGPPGRFWRRRDHRRRPALVLPASLARRQSSPRCAGSTTGSCPRARSTTTRWSPGASPRARSTPPSTRSPPRSRGASGSSSTGARDRSSSTSCRARPRCTIRGGDDLAGTPLEGVAFDPRGWKGASIAAGVVDFADAVREGRPPTVSGSDGLHGVHVAERAYASAAQGGIELEIDDEGTSR